ncbi:Hypothetical predicted protein [Mytilus galloprovincialis]|uniref:Uncharacterized protein n=1 Tax=Mytilus galloprovincialis TaxID=29158 RepID=A0A8B6H599_MYTGA|nr:Hypothetical predicted protein [Mytilus galloprovincialis]
MKGLQGVNGMRRIYLAREEARDPNLSDIRNKLSTVYDKNLIIPVTEQQPEYLRVRVSNIPSSADDEGHKAKEYQTPIKPASDNEATKDNDSFDSSENESGEETDIGDHVDHNETITSQFMYKPTEATTDIHYLLKV